MKQISVWVVFFALAFGSVLQPVHAQSSDPQFQQLLASIDGRRYTYALQCATLIFDVSGNVLIMAISYENSQACGRGSGRPSYRECARATITDREFFVPLSTNDRGCWIRIGTVEMRARINPDGGSIIVATEIDDGRVFKNPFIWRK